MTVEEQLRRSNELLDSLATYLKRSTLVDAEEQSQEEIDEIKESIEKYELEIAGLKEKLNDEKNYKRIPSIFEKEERPLIEELLEESIEKERKETLDSIQKYKKEQSALTQSITEYNTSIEKLKEEVQDIERRLKKDEIAKRRGIAKKLYLSDSELADLKEELQIRQQSITIGYTAIELMADEIRRFGRLITEADKKLRNNDKEQRLARIKEQKIEFKNREIDAYKLRLDKDELSKKEAGLEALRNRLEFLTYNPIENVQNIIKQNNDLLSSVSKDEKTVIADPSIEVPDTDNNFQVDLEARKIINDAIDNFVLDTPKNEDSNEEKETDEEVVKEDNTLFVETANALEENKDDKIEKEKEETSNEHKLEHPEEKIEYYLKEADSEPKELIVIDDASEELKEEKKSKLFQEKWRKWSKQLAAGALALVIGVSTTIGLFTPKNKDSENNDDIKEPDYEQTDKPDSSVQDTTQEENKNEEHETISKPEESKPIEQEKPVTKPTVNDSNTIVLPPVENTISPSEPVIPEVEPEVPNNTVEPEQNEMELNGIINNDTIETTVLNGVGEYVEVLLENGQVVYVDYGDTNTSVPEGITVKYEGDKMYVYSPIVKNKRM